MDRAIVARIEGIPYGGHEWAYDITTGEAVFEAIDGASAITIGAACPDAVGQ